MKLSFYGADRCVTGSCHCLEVNGKRILVDCGELTEKLADWLCGRKGIQAGHAAPESWRQHKEHQYDILAEGLRKALDMAAVRRILEEEETGR